MTNLLSKLIAQIAKIEATQNLKQYRPPSYDDVLHDGLVGTGEMLGTIAGTTAGVLGGGAIGGARGAIAGPAVLAPLGALAGGWAGHIAHLQGPLIKDIISHPENWTVDAAGAIVPVMPSPDARSDAGELNGIDVQSPTAEFRRLGTRRISAEQF